MCASGVSIGAEAVEARREAGEQEVGGHTLVERVANTHEQRRWPCDSPWHRFIMTRATPARHPVFTRWRTVRFSRRTRMPCIGRRALAGPERAELADAARGPGSRSCADTSTSASRAEARRARREVVEELRSAWRPLRGGDDRVTVMSRHDDRKQLVASSRTAPRTPARRALPVAYDEVLADGLRESLADEDATPAEEDVRRAGFLLHGNMAVSASGRAACWPASIRPTPRRRWRGRTPP